MVGEEAREAQKAHKGWDARVAFVLGFGYQLPEGGWCRVLALGGSSVPPSFGFLNPMDPTEWRVFDGYFQIIDPRFPLVPSRGYLTEPFIVEDYLERTSTMDIVGGAVVSGSFQGFNQSYLIDALERLGALPSWA